MHTAMADFAQLSVFDCLETDFLALLKESSTIWEAMMRVQDSSRYADILAQTQSSA